jgi:hypothetical protein
MKTKALIILAISAFVTLSFTFVNVSKTAETTENPKTEVTAKSEPVGGFLSQDKL